MYHVDIMNKGDSSFQVKSKDYEFLVDTKGKGVTPPDALLASLGTCVGVYLRKYAEGTHLDLKEFSISVSAEFAKEAPLCFREISVSIDLKGIKLDEQKQTALMRFIKNCPVHSTLKVDPKVNVSLS